MASKPTSKEDFLNSSLIDGKERIRISKQDTTGQKLWKNFAVDFRGFLNWLLPNILVPPASLQLQSDWTEADTNSVRFIRNKPATYKNYLVKISQSGTNAPTVTTPINSQLSNAIGNVVFSYIGVGTYTAEFDDIVAPQAKIVPFTSSGGNLSILFTASAASDNEIIMQTAVISGTDLIISDNCLNDAPLEIRVYD